MRFWGRELAGWLLILIGNSYGIFVRGHDVLGVEFAGGVNITLSFDQRHKIGVDKLREAAAKASSGEVLVSYQRDISKGTDDLRITARTNSRSSAVLTSGGARSTIATSMRMPASSARSCSSFSRRSSVEGGSATKRPSAPRRNA